MKIFYFTYGYGQNPGIGYYTKVYAVDEGEARRKMHEIYKDKWSFVYTSAEAAGVERFNLELWDTIA